MKSPTKAVCLLLSAVLMFAGVPASAIHPAKAEAASSGVSLDDGDYEQSDGVSSGEPDCYVGDSGTISYVGTHVDVYFSSSDSTIASVDASTGKYTVSDEGKVTVSVVASEDGGEGTTVASYEFLCGESLSGATLAKEGFGYVAGTTDKESSTDVSFDDMPEMNYSSFSIESAEGKHVDVSEKDSYFDAEEQTVHFEAEGVGSAKIRFTVNDTTFTYKLMIKRVTLNAGQATVVKGKSVSLKLKNFKGKAKSWTSSKKGVATVSAMGKTKVRVKGKKVGTTIVYANIGGKKVGCAVSVVKKGRLKAMKRAEKIAKGTYSQSKRMRTGYYDCSSLVWRSYRLAGVYFGKKRWAPTAAGIGYWCVKRGKRIKGGLTKTNVQNLKLRAGDLFFRTHGGNGRYKGIYHVEMMTGYRWLGTKSNGKPDLTVTWANRDDGYACYCGDMMCRP